MKTIIVSILIMMAFCANAQNEADWLDCAKGDMNFIVANDLGRNGYYDQKKIADLMGAVADAVGPEAVLALGDTHHFEGIESTSDPLWMTNFESIYTHPELMIEWLPICGNHEYRGNTQAVVDYTSVSRRWEMPARYYSKCFEHKGLSVRIVFLDTTPLIAKYRNDTTTYPDACLQDAATQLNWLDSTLASATEDWVVVVGHHPIYADTNKSESERRDMQNSVDPILRKYNVPLYICGHIHNFQHISKSDSPVDYVVNTSGSLSRAKVKAIDGTKYTSGASGFSLLDFSKTTLTLSMVDNDGNVIYKLVKSK